MMTMGNRLLKESIKRSPQIDSLSWFEEVVFYRLIVTVDDYGCCDGRCVVLRADLFPTKESITKKAISDALSKLEKVGLIESYEVDGMPYLHLTTWDKHQRIRDSKHRVPAFSRELPQVAADCGELPQVAADCGLNPIRIQSESNPNISCAEPPQASHAQSVPPVFQIPLNDNSLFGVTVDMLKRWKELYPAVNIEQSMRDIVGWCEANPRKRKTRNGVMRFVNSWLAKEQNRGGKGYQSGTNVGYGSNSGGYDWHNDPAYQGII